GGRAFPGRQGRQPAGVRRPRPHGDGERGGDRSQRPRRLDLRWGAHSHLAELAAEFRVAGPRGAAGTAQAPPLPHRRRRGDRTTRDGGGAARHAAGRVACPPAARRGGGERLRQLQRRVCSAGTRAAHHTPYGGPEGRRAPRPRGRVDRLAARRLERRREVHRPRVGEVTLVSTPAVVLQTYRYSETSKIVRLATRDLGVQSAIAKGVMRPRSPFGAALETLSEGVAQLYHKETRELQTLAAFDIVELRRGLAGDVGRFAGAEALAEVMLKMAPPAPLPSAYDTFLLGLDALAQAAPTQADAVAVRWLWLLVGVLGFSPQLENCVRD